MSDNPVSPEIPDNESVAGRLQDLERRAELAAVAAEAAAQKAQSESGYAFNAKQNSEEHASSIAKIRGSVEADSAWLLQTKHNIETNAESISTVQKAVHQDQVSVAADADRLRSLRTAAETAYGDVERAQTSTAGLFARASDDAAVITQARVTAESQASIASSSQSQAAEALAKVQADREAIANTLSESRTIVASMAQAAESANTALAKVTDYESTLRGLDIEMQALRAKIESLLPGATSAGLASAFQREQGRFRLPQVVWVIVFILSICGLLLSSLYDSPAFLPSSDVTWDVIKRHYTARIPLVVPLVWLALYAGRHYTMALRLQEDYAYKAAISTSFEGYRREMADIPLPADQVAPLLRLCENVLRTLGQRPGRLYDGAHDDITPLSPVAKLLQRVLGTGNQSQSS